MRRFTELCKAIQQPTEFIGPLFKKNLECSHRSLLVRRSKEAQRGIPILRLLPLRKDASPDQVTIDVQWSANELRMEICDRGAGLTPMTQARAGQMLFTTKMSDEIGAGGLGLGLFLAHATLGRFGGSVQLSNREGGGACPCVVLPLAHLMP